MPLSTGWRETAHVCAPPTICSASVAKYGRVWVCACGLQWRVVSNYAPDQNQNVKVDYVIVKQPTKIEW